jgi:hypothetical protein
MLFYILVSTQPWFLWGMPSAEIDGTAYGRELEQRRKIGITPPNNLMP